MFKVMELLACLAVLVHQGTATEVIYRLSNEEYSRMPVKTYLDRFAHCLRRPGGVYCTAHADVSAGPAELLRVMRGYSAHDVTHYNYTKLVYGLCMTGTCREFYNGTGEQELRAAAEACLDDLLARDYGLKTEIRNMYCYFEDETKNDRYSFDWVDWAAAAVLLCIVALNVAGTAYDYKRSQTEPGNKYLLSFSWRRNWAQLMAPPSADPRASELQSLNGIRFLTCLIIVFPHFLLILGFWIEDTNTMEQRYSSEYYYAMTNGTLVTQSFFLMSGFLLSYNMEISTKENQIIMTWKNYVKMIALRYVRLSSVGLLSLLLVATFLRFNSIGPLSQMMYTEVDDCRKYWMYHLLLVNNYVPGSTCLAQTWSSSVDFHLHILGLSVMLLAEGRRRAALAGLFAVSLLIPPLTVLYFDLEGTLLGKPEYYNLDYDPTYYYLYSSTQNNVSVFLIGMAFGYIVYDRQRRKVTSQDYTKYRFYYWLLLVVLVSPMQMAGYLFYQDGPRASLLLRALFPLTKPLFGLSVALIILGAVHKVENLYRRILEWYWFIPLAKLTYCIYTLHILVYRFISGARPTLLSCSLLHVSVEFFGCFAVVVLLSVVVHLSVEAPVTRLSKMALAPARPRPAKEDKTE